MYTLRQKADYEVDLPPECEARMEAEALAADLVAAAASWVARLPHLDVSPVVPLLDPRV
ncbi:MAG: hypothetical protein ACJ8GN_24595 [Longimicrobiaceae bacterium]